MLYHVSPITGLKTLRPHVSTHKKAYVYALENMVTAILFGAKHDDFDFIIDTDEQNIPVIYECYPGALVKIYQGKRCSVYEVENGDFQRGKTAWAPELVCGHEVPVKKEIIIEDLYKRLLEEEQNGSLQIHRYEFSDTYRKKIASHIVDRLFRFEIDLEACLKQDDRFSSHYKDLIQGLSAAMDGHLLP